jgi:hypothetical protein
MSIVASSIFKPLDNLRLNCPLSYKKAFALVIPILPIILNKLRLKILLISFDQ